MAHALKFCALDSRKTQPPMDLGAFEGKCVKVSPVEDGRKRSWTSMDASRTPLCRFGTSADEIDIRKNVDASLPEDDFRGTRPALGPGTS